MKTVLEQALEALEYHTTQTRPIAKTNEAIAALKEAIKQQGEPVGEVVNSGASWEKIALVKFCGDRPTLGTKLYTSAHKGEPDA